MGEAPLQLYSLGTPNDVKITVMLEELRASGKTDAAYDLHIIDIDKLEQFGSDFVKLNPNSKNPVLLDRFKSLVQSVFESCAILIYLAKKFDTLLPEDATDRTECLSWLFWQGSSASFLGGGFGHFYSYAPYPMKYPINRCAMESKLQLDVLDRHLAEREYMCACGYSIADIAMSWYGRLPMGDVYDAEEFSRYGLVHARRMSKVKQKVSGCFRNSQYADAYCRISSYLQTPANKEHKPLIAIQMALAGGIGGE